MTVDDGVLMVEGGVAEAGAGEVDGVGGGARLVADDKTFEDDGAFVDCTEFVSADESPRLSHDMTNSSAVTEMRLIARGCTHAECSFLRVSASCHSCETNRAAEPVRVSTSRWVGPCRYTSWPNWKAPEMKSQTQVLIAVGVTRSWCGKGDG